jgi:hypothetical protein
VFLSSCDMNRLTGYVRPSAQARWLRRNGYRFTVNGLGEPVVAEAEAARKLIGGSSSVTQEPNFGAINGTA